MVKTTVSAIRRHIRKLHAAAIRQMALPWQTATVLLLIVCFVAGAADKPPREEKIRTDCYGDPLPEGATARLGTTRFRQGFITYEVAFSPDGKMIACAAGGGGVCLWDAATGKRLRQIGEESYAVSVALSPDNKVVACYFSWPKSRAALYETPTGRKIADLPQNTNGLLAFSPDGKALAAVIAPASAIHLLDAVTGKPQNKQTDPKEDRTYHLAWSPGGKKLAWVGQKGVIHLWDANKGEEIGQWKGHAQAIHGVAFAPDGNTLATVSKDQTIRLWEVATHKEKYVLDGKPQQIRNEWGPALVFSPDGRVLASNHSDGTIVLWDAAKGKEIRRWQAHVFAATSLDFAPDGKTLVSGGFAESGLRLWDVATGTEVRPFVAHTAGIDHVTFSQDGKRVVSLGMDKKLFDWDLANGRGTRRLQLPFHAGPPIVDRNILSPRGDRVASWSDEEDAIHLWDVATGKERGTLKQSGRNRRGDNLGALAFSPDSRLFAFGTEDNAVVLWDTIAGVERRRLKGLTGLARCAAFSGDGQKIAAGSGRGASVALGLWDVTSGKLLSSISSGPMDRLGISPDGALVAASDGGRGVFLFDGTTGREVRPLLDTPRFALGVAFSPDGKWLAATEEALKDAKVHVWEVNTGLKVRCFPAPYGGTFGVAFAPDGRTLASGCSDSSILLWDFTGRIEDGRLQTARWTPEELEKRWSDLASKSGPQAVQALWDLVAAPEQAVPLLRQRVRPVQAVDAERVERLIRDLDSDDFQTRSKASAELEKIVDWAEPALRKKLAEKPSLEVRRRIEQVLTKLEPSADAERLRALRAVQVLEYAATPEAQKCLETLAGGLAEARLTRDATAALRRLAK